MTANAPCEQVKTEMMARVDGQSSGHSEIGDGVDFLGIRWTVFTLVAVDGMVPWKTAFL